MIIYNYILLSIIIGYFLMDKRYKRDKESSLKTFFKLMKGTNKIHLVAELVLHILLWQVVLLISIIKQVFINEWK